MSCECENYEYIKEFDITEYTTPEFGISESATTELGIPESAAVEFD